VTSHIPVLHHCQEVSADSCQRTSYPLVNCRDIPRLCQRGPNSAALRGIPRFHGQTKVSPMHSTIAARDCDCDCDCDPDDNFANAVHSLLKLDQPNHLNQVSKSLLSSLEAVCQ
jgi:hypothetical protein